MRPDLRWLVIGSLLAGAAVAPGCKTREIAAPSGQKTLFFSDDFERAELGAAWRRGEATGPGEGGPGRWRIDEGWLVASDIKNDPLWWTGQLPDQTRVEFDAQAMSAQGDLKIEIFGDGELHESGYIVILGGWNNTLDVVARLDEHGDDRKAQPSIKPEPGQTHRVAVERTGGQLRVYVDDALVMAYDDDEPLRGPGHQSFGFNDWTAPVRFDNLEIYKLGS